MPNKSCFQSQLEDSEVLAELREGGVITDAMSEMPSSLEVAMDHVSAIESLRTGDAKLDSPSALEAIVMTQGYPALLVKDGDYERPKLKVWRDRLDPHREKIKNVISSVGRVELSNHGMPWAGTCWVVDEYTLVTNRHVAEIFTSVFGDRIEIMPKVGVRVDFREEFGSTNKQEVKIDKVSYIDAGVDLALMKLSRSAVDLGIQPIPISDSKEDPEFIGVCGYPARDSRNPAQDMARIFRDIYNVKRLAPGKIMDPNETSRTFTHNCTTLGGNSGSAVFDVATGAAIGLHFAGNALDSNRAVNLKWLRETLVKQGVQIRVPDDIRGDHDGDNDNERRERFGDRDGYQPDFIGSGTPPIPLPGLNMMQASDVSLTKSGGQVLDYQHFSVVMSKRRRLAYFTAANIDGSSLRRPKRIKTFRLDPRMDKDLQADNDLYKNNDLDRGHLIRRLDPCWGSAADAKQANRDSMFYTNIAPQHKDLNQRVWRELEDHILDNTDDENARVSVFVGCLFDDDDPPQKKTGIKVPMGFWKVVASSTRPTGGRRRRRQLQTQAFVLFQSHLVKKTDLELIFGGIDGVKQITVEELERLSGLDFGVMRDADTFGLPPDVREQMMTESLAVHQELASRSAHYRSIESMDDIV